MRAILFLFMIWSLSACLKITDLPKEDPAPDVTVEPAQPSPLAEETVVTPAHVEELNEPNHYQVILPVPGKAQMVRRFIKNKPESATAFPAKVKDGTLVDEQIEPDQTYVYELGSIKEGNFESFQSFELKVPLDLEIQNELVLQQDENWARYHRIFMNSNSIITTNGHHLIIQTDQLHSDGGLIRTFPSGSQASQGQDAAAGGSIQILAQSGEGHLKFELRGQNGGTGRDGISPPNEYSAVRPCSPAFPPCYGEVGLPGGDGLSGGKGGSSGQAEIQIKEKHSLDIEVKFEEGRGGKGGQPGKGQALGGRIIAKGEDGKSVGADGTVGATEKLCLQDLSGLNCLWQNGLLKVE